MKKIFAILVIFLICAVGKTATDSNNTIVPDSNIIAVPDTNTTVDCQEKIKQLEQTVKAQRQRINRLTDALKDVRKQLDEQIKENERLKALLPKDKINSVVPAASFDPNSGIVYNGKKRDVRWFNYMFKEFQNKMALVDGKYIYITGALEKRQGEVLQVLGNGEAIICQKGRQGFRSYMVGGRGGAGGELWEKMQTGVASTPSTPDTFYHIKGYKGSMVDKQPFDCNIIGNGNFEYIDTSGAKRAIQSFVIYEPLTKEQFAEAINSGFELVSRKSVNGKVIETPMR